MAEHYAQRATDGGLLITEATLINPTTAGGTPNAPGIYSSSQIDGWRKVTDAGHANAQPVAPSAIAISGKDDFGNDWEVPRELTVDEMANIVQDFAQAAKNAIEAGFDGVEIHGANGYLIDQFLNTSSNVRTDEYGGSPGNCSRFALQVIDAVVNAIGEQKTAIRFSPFSGYQGMEDNAPYETWGYVLGELQKRYPDMAYIHMVEPRVDAESQESLDPFRAKWSGSFISSGNYTYSSKLAIDVAESTGNLIGFSRTFTSNPDLVERLKNGWSLAKYDRETFFSGGAKGYIDFPNYSP